MRASLFTSRSDLRFAAVALLALAACAGGKADAAGRAEPSAAPAPSAAPSGASTAALPSAVATAAAVAREAPPSETDGGRAPSPSSATSAAPPASSATAKSGYADEIPKACTDSFGRLGLLTFTDLGGGKVRVSSPKNAGALCVRGGPNQYQCDWTFEGKPSGSFPARFDAEKKSVNGSIAKGKMFGCSSLQR